MFNGDFVFYFIVTVGIFSMFLFCLYTCRRAYKNHNLTNPSHTWQTVPQQPAHNRSLSPFGNPSAQPRNQETVSLFNRANFPTSPNAVSSAGQSYNILVTPSTPQLYSVPSDSNRSNISLPNTAASFSGGNSSIQTSGAVPRALEAYNVLVTPSAPELYNVAGESYRTNIQTPHNSEVIDDLPPDYTTVVLADLAKGNEHPQYPRVIQKES